MNCRACGTPLQQTEAYCPNCGALTLSASSTNQAAPDDTTGVSSPAALAQPTGSASPSYPNPYDHNPYELSYSAQPPPPPPSPGRRSKRIGIIIGAALLALLLIGGGVLVWFVSSSASHATAAGATATVRAHASATPASQHVTAKGSGTRVSSATNTVQQDGDNQIASITVHSVISGDITGSLTSEETDILYPDKTVTFSGKSSCICTIAGKSGTLTWSYTGTTTADGNFQGHTFDIQGTGDVASVHGQGTFQGQAEHDTYSSQLSFDA